MVPTAPEPGSGPLAPALVAALQARMGTDGFVPFDRFMDVALYGAGVGYYARARSPFGPQGDYYTAPRVHPLFARTVTARVLEVHRALGRPAPFRVVDLGSGDGGLLAGILRSLAGRRSPEGLEALVVDRSAARRASSLEAVRSAVGGSEVPVDAAASVAGRQVGSSPAPQSAHPPGDP